MINDIDIKETELYDLFPEAFNMLLRDQTRIKDYNQKNSNEMNADELESHKDDPINHIIWATDDYNGLGKGYFFHDPITTKKIIDKNGMIIKPRCKKNIEEQNSRIKDKAEVFTPSWVCNCQNNLVDENWFGRANVFNCEIIDEEGNHSWITTRSRIEFPQGKSWKDYINDIRLEITCGEAPYICSRYDTTTGKVIDIHNRIGMLDRKLRIISENVHNSGEWLKVAQEAFKSVYGYEWQGDNLLLARESLLCTFLEYYFEKFKKLPLKKSVNTIAEIISWNIWQMDGLKMVIPDSCNNIYESNLFGQTKKICQACQNGDVHNHIGLTCYIKDWNRSKKQQEISFSSLF